MRTNSSEPTTTSDWVAPRSVSNVVMLYLNSAASGILSSASICILRFLRTLLTWDLDSVGGRFTASASIHHHHYRQHCTQRKALAYKLLRGQFWGLSPHRGDKLHRWGWNLVQRSRPLGPLLHTTITPCQVSPHWCNDKGIGSPKTELFTEILPKSKHKRPTGGIPCAGSLY